MNGDEVIYEEQSKIFGYYIIPEYQMSLETYTEEYENNIPPNQTLSIAI